jgi:hypothetical protein
MPLRGARCGERMMAAGGTVPRNDTSLSAQRMCSARTVPGMAAQRRPGRTVSGTDSGRCHGIGVAMIRLLTMALAS